jgi:HD-GYP domain-containing protein (c-di-GMP phosphodiesterase class II)
LSILEKNGKLTPEEYEIMKTHVTHSKEILQHELNFDIIEIAYRHHERIDGTGYPNMVPGERMTLEQKIMQVSDVYSALIAKRSYKDEFSITDTMNILFEEANNKKFDMSVVEMLNKYSKKVVKSTNKLMEEANNTYSKISNERNKLIEFYEKRPELKSIDLYD